MTSPKITKKTKFSEGEVVKDFLDGLEGKELNNNLIENQSDKFKEQFESISKADQRKVLEFIAFLAFKSKRKKVLDK